MKEGREGLLKENQWDHMLIACPVRIIQSPLAN